jgi:hypothetical protein
MLDSSGSGSGFPPSPQGLRRGTQGSAQPLAAEAASLIGKETYELRTSNVQHRINEFCLSIK